MNSIIERILLHLFLWSGSKLYSTVSIYCPDRKDDGKVMAIHFGTDERTLVRSCKELVENSLTTDG